MFPAINETEDRRQADRREGERRLLQAEADTRRMVREQAQRNERRANRPAAFASNYGSSSSYTPATDFVPTATPGAEEG